MRSTPRRQSHLPRDRELIVELHGVGFHRTETVGQTTSDRRLTDVPLLNLRLLPTTNEDSIPRNSDGTIKWQRVLDNHGNPVEKTLLRPIRTPGAFHASERFSAKLAKAFG